MSAFGEDFAMEINPGILAVHSLALKEYRFTVVGETINAEFEGSGKPDQIQVQSLLKTIKEHKDDVVDFLRVYCPKCGGVCFVSIRDRILCAACDWQEIVKLFPQIEE
jgi:ribosomal protein S27AE